MEIWYREERRGEERKMDKKHAREIKETRRHERDMSVRIC
jgi:hypothetical protein